MSDSASVWGTVAEWVGGLSAGIALGVAAVTYYWDRLRERRSQAARVLCWVHPNEHGVVEISVKNFSEQPIFELGYSVIPKTQKEVSKQLALCGGHVFHKTPSRAADVTFAMTRSLIDPWSRIDFPAGATCSEIPDLPHNAEFYDYVVTFVDASGHRWHKDPISRKYRGMRFRRRLKRIAPDLNGARFVSSGNYSDEVWIEVDFRGQSLDYPETVWSLAVEGYAAMDHTFTREKLLAALPSSQYSLEEHYSYPGRPKKGADYELKVVSTSSSDAAWQRLVLTQYATELSPDFEQSPMLQDRAVDVATKHVSRSQGLGLDCLSLVDYNVGEGGRAAIVTVGIVDGESLKVSVCKITHAILLATTVDSA